MLPTRIQAIIFDMDGVLIDSEPYWQQAEVDAFNDVGLKLTLADTKQTTGLRIDQVVDYWFRRHPWSRVSPATVVTTIENKMVERLLTDGMAMPGCYEALTACQHLGLSIGLATSSPNTIVNAVLTRLAITPFFHAITSAEGLAYGKPHPEVYLNCAAELTTNPVHCLAVEDSFNGAIAARAANMQTLVIPASEEQQSPCWAIAHHQLPQLDQLAGLLQNQYRITST